VFLILQKGGSCLDELTCFPWLSSSGEPPLGLIIAGANRDSYKGCCTLAGVHRLALACCSAT